MKSQAVFLIKKGNADQAFQLKDFKLNDLKSGELLIESEAFGLNYADVMARRGLYGDAPPFPAIIGYEVVGKVVNVGENVDPNLKGKRVLAFCRFGGYGKHVITKDDAIVQVKDEPAELLMGLCTQSVTAYYMAEYLSPIRKGDKVLVHAAAGGVGTILCQLAKWKGAEVFAKIGDNTKRPVLEKLKVDYLVNYNEGDYEESIKKILKGSKLDVSFNPVGGSTYKKDMRLLGSGGRLYLFGGSELGSGKFGFFSKLGFVFKMGFHTPIVLMMKSQSILGVNMLKVADDKPEVLNECLKAVVKLYQEGIIIPQVGGTFHVNDISKAHELLETGKSTGKLTIKW